MIKRWLLKKWALSLVRRLATRYGSRMCQSQYNLLHNLCLLGSCVTTDSTTSKSAGIMVMSVIPFIVVQLPQVFHHISWASSAVMAALILAIVLLISYCLYQIFEPWIQKRRVAYAKHKHPIAGLLRHMNKSSLGRLVDHNGEPNVSNIEKTFELIDVDMTAKFLCQR